MPSFMFLLFVNWLLFMSLCLFWQAYKSWHFWLNTVDAIWQSLVIFFIPWLAYNGLQVGMNELGTICMNALVFTSLVHVALETNRFVSHCPFLDVVDFFWIAGVFAVYYVYSFPSHEIDDKISLLASEFFVVGWPVATTMWKQHWLMTRTMFLERHGPWSGSLSGDRTFATLVVAGELSTTVHRL